VLRQVLLIEFDEVLLCHVEFLLIEAEVESPPLS
jgi:hypothetical protein